MRKARIVQIVGLLLCGGLIAASALRIEPINRGREKLNIRGSVSPVENAPPAYAFAVQALGAFRGLITDIAFIRAEQMKEAGRYYDAMELHELMCTLQPLFPSVWEYAAWNMSWNISVTTFTPQERWKWVYNGIKLLRDHGIQWNPRAVNLYKQLAWTFNNKMSATLDEFNYAYKCEWAWRMHLLLGPRPDPLSEVDLKALAEQLDSPDDADLLAEAGRKALEQNIEKRRKTAALIGREYNERKVEDVFAKSPGGDQITEFDVARWAVREQMRKINEAARSLDELFARYPETRAMVQGLRAIGVYISDDTLDEDSYWRQDGLAFTFFQPYRELKTPSFSVANVRSDAGPGQSPLARRSDQIDRLLGVRAENPAGAALVRFLQRKVLLEVYKLDPKHMLYVVDNFGPVDWRSVDAHSLYWVTRGLIAGDETINNFKNDKTNTARIIFFSLRNLWLYNEIVFEPNPDAIHLSYLNRTQDLNFIEPMHQAMIRYGPLFDPDADETAGAGDTFRSGHINFLTEAIRMLYLAGREDEARHYYDYLRSEYALTPSGTPNEAVQKPLQEYVLDSFYESMAVPGQRDIQVTLTGMLLDAYTQLARDNVVGYDRRVKAAAAFHRDYMAEKWNDPAWQRVAVKPFPDCQIDAFRLWLSQSPSAQSITPTMRKVELWRRAPLWLRQGVYDELVKPNQAGHSPLKIECDYWDLDVARAFPEPKGMEAYRELHAKRAGEEQGDATETIGPGK